MFQVLKQGLGGIFILSSGLKIFAIGYLTDLLYSLMPTNWISWMTEGLLISVLIVIIASELLLGILLWKGIYLSGVLTGIIVFLIAMVLINYYQLWSGVDDCGCLGGWVILSPEITLFKTGVLLILSIYLKKLLHLKSLAGDTPAIKQ